MASIETVVNVMREGAADFVVKPVSPGACSVDAQRCARRPTRDRAVLPPWPTADRAA